MQDLALSAGVGRGSILGLPSYPQIKIESDEPWECAESDEPWECAESDEPWECAESCELKRKFFRIWQIQAAIT